MQCNDYTCWSMWLIRHHFAGLQSRQWVPWLAGPQVSECPKVFPCPPVARHLNILILVLIIAIATGSSHPRLPKHSWPSSLVTFWWQVICTIKGWDGNVLLLHRQEPNTVVMHIRMLDKTAQLQQEAVGVLGINLIHACFTMGDNTAPIIGCLLEELSRARVEVSTNPGFALMEALPGMWSRAGIAVEDLACWALAEQHSILCLPKLQTFQLMQHCHGKASQAVRAC